MGGLVFCIFLLFIYYGTIILGIKQCPLSFWKNKRNVLSFFIMGILLIAYSSWFISSEHFIYYWDFGSYWYKGVLSDYLNMSLMDVTSALEQSINVDDYNILPTLLVAAPLKLFGNKYSAFVILNVTMFLLPTAFILTTTISVSFERADINDGNPILMLLIPASFSTMLVPILVGYVDIVCMPMLSLAFLLCIIKRDFKKIDYRKDLLIAASLIWVLLMRRYFAFAMVGGAVFVVPYWFLWREKSTSADSEPVVTESSFYLKGRNKGNTEAARKVPGKKANTYLIRALDLVIAVVPIIVFLIFLAPELLMRYFFNNYNESYSAYSTGTIWTNLGSLALYFGVLFLIYIFTANVLFINREYNLLSWCLTLSMIVTAILFFRVQDMGKQHRYVIICQVVLLIALGYGGVIRKLKRSGGGILATILLINFCVQFQIIPMSRSLLFVSERLSPRTREDIEEIQALDYCVDKLILDGGKIAYTTTSSFIINADICNKAFAPEFPMHTWVHTSDVDLRDGFNNVFFAADVIISSDSPQTHLTHGQEVVTQLNALFETDTEFRRHYREVGSFVLDGGVTAIVWEKTEALSRDDIMMVKGIFDNIYPDKGELFGERIEGYLKDIS